MTGVRCGPSGERRDFERDQVRRSLPSGAGLQDSRIERQQSRETHFDLNPASLILRCRKRWPFSAMSQSLLYSRHTLIALAKPGSEREKASTIIQPSYLILFSAVRASRKSIWPLPGVP